MTIHNTIIAANTSIDISNMGGTISGSNNLIGNGVGQSGLINGQNGNIVGTSKSPITPMFVEGSYQLAAGSPAINKGNNAFAVDAEGNPLTMDMAGNSRFAGKGIDIGTYEYTSSVSVSAVIRDMAGSTTSAIHEWQRFSCELWVSSELTSGTQIMLAYDANLFVPTVINGEVQYQADLGIDFLAQPARMSHQQHGVMEFLFAENDANEESAETIPVFYQMAQQRLQRRWNR